MSNDELVGWLKMQEGSANQNAVECGYLGTKLKAGVWTDRAAKYSAIATALSSQAAEIAELRMALAGMVDNFRPFTSKPMGAPHSPARLEQEAQIAAYNNARALTRKEG